MARQMLFFGICSGAFVCEGSWVPRGDQGILQDAGIAIGENAVLHCGNSHRYSCVALLVHQFAHVRLDALIIRSCLGESICRAINLPYPPLQ